MIEVYTDASVSKGKAVATCYIMNSKDFLGVQTFDYVNINSGIHGELLGIRDGIKYTLSQFEGNHEPITIYSDSNAAIDLITQQCSKTTTFKELVTEINKLCTGHCINFMLIRGHQITHNPNKVVDLISNSVLRHIMKGV